MAITELACVVTDHLAHEEREMEPIVAANLAAPEFLAAQKVVRRGQLGNTGSLFAWLLDGADHDSVSALRREVPRPVLFVITRTSGRRYRRSVSSVWAAEGAEADGVRPPSGHRRARAAFAVSRMRLRN